MTPARFTGDSDRDLRAKHLAARIGSLNAAAPPALVGLCCMVVCDPDAPSDKLLMLSDAVREYAVHCAVLGASEDEIAGILALATMLSDVAPERANVALCPQEA